MAKIVKRYRRLRSTGLEEILSMVDKIYRISFSSDGKQNTVCVEIYTGGPSSSIICQTDGFNAR